MFLKEKHKECGIISQSAKLITDDVYNSLLENCFAALTGRPEVTSIGTLYGSKGDAVKEFYAFLLWVSAEFVRNGAAKEDILQLSDCGITAARIKLYEEYFYKHRLNIESSLLNIGSCFPHLIDVKWKIDYIIKSSMVNQPDGPLFRICLIAEEYDEEKERKQSKNISFTCSSQELQDLIYKLKDAVRTCQLVTNRIG